MKYKDETERRDKLYIFSEDDFFFSSFFYFSQTLIEKGFESIESFSQSQIFLSLNICHLME